MEPTKLLFVDDDSLVLDLFVKKFVKEGYRVDTAITAASAMDKIKRGFVPDAVISDVKMGDMDGFTFVVQLREQNLIKPETKLIMFSSMVQDMYIQKAKELGVDGYIVKLTDPAEMMNQVKEILAGKKIFASAV